MKDSLACLSCVVTLARCITVLRLFLKQAKEKGICVCVRVFRLMRGWIQVLASERNSLLRVIVEMQMTAGVHIHMKMESSSVLITL